MQHRFSFAYQELYYHATVIVSATQVSNPMMIRLYPNFDGLSDIMFVPDPQKGWKPFLDIGILEQLLTPHLQSLIDRQFAMDRSHDVFSYGL